MYIPHTAEMHTRSMVPRTSLHLADVGLAISRPSEIGY